MKKMNKILALLSLSLASVSSFPNVSTAAAPELTLHNDNSNGSFGDWYTGAVPPNASSNKPVILFVQGLHSNYTTWTATDDYYTAAYNAGYRTAFVQLKDSEGAGGNMWTNGPVLADVIKKVANYYGVSKINVIAHSKGGIDTQTALVYYGASPYVNVVHQLSTPNKGSELADLAYSSWASWLSDIIGMKDDAVYSLQTSYMTNFRSQTDSKSENNSTTTYMSAGTGDDGFFSSTWFAHAFLTGSDDGAVSVTSAFGLPKGIQSFTDNGSEKLSHSMMRKASKTWAQVQPKLTLSSLASYRSAKKEQTSANPEEISNMIVRGGEISGETTGQFTLEKGITSIALDVMTSSSETKVELVSPSGKIYSPKDGSNTSENPDELFSKSIHNMFKLKKPEKGEWTVNISGDKDAYFLIASIEGGAEVKLHAKKKVYKKGDTAKISFATDEGMIKKSSKLETKITRSTDANEKVSQKIKWISATDGALAAQFDVPSKPGVYNLSFDITGLDKNDEPFTRSVNYNFAVTDKNGELPKE